MFKMCCNFLKPELNDKPPHICKLNYQQFIYAMLSLCDIRYKFVYLSMDGITFPINIASIRHPLWYHQDLILLTFRDFVVDTAF